MRIVRLFAALSAALILASCATKKPAADSSRTSTQTTTPAAPTARQDNGAQKAAQEQLAFVGKVAKTAVDADNVTAKIDFNLKTDSKDITVSGKLMMRRDDVIRIQLQVPVLGMEAGRLEFTKDYVMIVDRIHTEYIKGDYNEVDFLRNNGINFNALQALFWNQLFVPGEQKLGDAQLRQFHVELKSGQDCSLISLMRDQMSYLWQAENQSGHIRQTTVEYKGGQSGSTRLTCSYDDFRKLGAKEFPASIALSMNTSATKKSRQIQVNISARSLGTDSNWDGRTTLSKKYKPVSADEVMKKITSL